MKLSELRRDLSAAREELRTCRAERAAHVERLAEAEREARRALTTCTAERDAARADLERLQWLALAVLDTDLNSDDWNAPFCALRAALPASPPCPKGCKQP